ncbi:hypothetical protein RB195_003577 [Necator americanus]|uniref:Uncharacterized protein n=1 Tax=Necator americanus TaxID=51031 RepID=A0ABR1DP69_NECAM
MTISTCNANAHTLASNAENEDLICKPGSLSTTPPTTETRQLHSLSAMYDTGEELFLGTGDSRRVGGVDVLVNTSMAENIGSFKQLATRIRRMRRRRCGATPASTVFVAYGQIPNYEEGVDDSKWT